MYVLIIEVNLACREVCLFNLHLMGSKINDFGSSPKVGDGKFLEAVDCNGEVDSSGNSPRLETPQELATRRLEPAPRKSVPRSEDQPQVTW